LVYTREELPLLFLPRRIRSFYEAHQLRGSFFLRLLIKKATGIIAISQGLKDAFVRGGFPPERILVAHDGYDEKAFAERIDKQAARKKLSLPPDKKIAMYIGGLEEWKGAETLCRAASFLAETGILVAIIGGTDAEIQRFRQKYPAVLFLGRRPYQELPFIQQAADALVVPNSGRERISREFTSPLKLFAHMASGIPLVVSDVPAIREVLSDNEAEFFTPDDAQSLAHALRRALAGSGGVKAEAALKKSILYTWDKRAQSVLAYIHALKQ
jgi:glycosyltransferase involved in cell wall biosynthesis